DTSGSPRRAQLVDDSSETVSDAIASTGRRVLAGGIWQTASYIGPYLYTTLTSIIAARILGPERMGRQSFIAFIVLATSTACSGGLPVSITRYVADLIGRGRDGTLLTLNTWMWRVATLLGFVSAGVLVLVAASAA